MRHEPNALQHFPVDSRNNYFIWKLAYDSAHVFSKAVTKREKERRAWVREQHGAFSNAVIVSKYAEKFPVCEAVAAQEVNEILSADRELGKLIDEDNRRELFIDQCRKLYRDALAAGEYAAGRFRRITGARDGMTALVRALKDHENATTCVAPRKQAA